MMKKLLFLLAFALSFNLSAQLTDGTQAPDFTLTDLDGNTHNLYDYLNAGKTVFIDIFAAHCPTCWSYHQTERLKNMYNLYGPNGTDEIMVLALEHDQYNFYDAFIGIGPAWVTQGNWIDGTPYPIFDVEDPDRGVFTDYNVNYYPLIYKICPGGLTEVISISYAESILYQKVQDCITNLSVEEEEQIGNVYIDQIQKNLVIDQYEKVNSIRIVNLQGQTIQEINSVTSGTISVNTLNTGIYLFQLKTNNGPVIKKLYLN
jgi:hypothetical protein